MPSSAFVIDLQNQIVDALNRGDDTEADRIAREWLGVEITVPEAERWLANERSARMTTAQKLRK